MKPNLRFHVLEWHDEVYVVRVRIFGTGPDGLPIDREQALPQLYTVEEVAAMVAKINRGNFRPMKSE